jgi:ABC-2 type transport system ATP-binding protein
VIELASVMVHRHRFRLGPVDLALEERDALAVVGPNGCGKSTLLRALTTRMPIASGSATVLGHDLVSNPAVALRHIGEAVAPESLPAMFTARQCLDLVGRARGLGGSDPEVVAAAGPLGLLDLDAPVGALSLGTRQKVAVLLALTGHPEILVLDEVFNGLDWAARDVLYDMLVDKLGAGGALVIATHDLEVARKVANRMLLLEEGRVIGTWDRRAFEAIRGDLYAALRRAPSPR